jgi:hypothetical protein
VTGPAIEKSREAGASELPARREHFLDVPEPSADDGREQVDVHAGARGRLT